MSALAMQEIAVEDAVGQILCHDITEIVRGVRKGARFRKGHVVEAADIPVLLSLGKEHLYVWENDGTLLHENEAAEILRGFCQNEGMEASERRRARSSFGRFMTAYSLSTSSASIGSTISMTSWWLVRRSTWRSRRVTCSQGCA